MIFFVSIFLLASLQSIILAKEEKFYNILSLEAAQAKGILTAEFVDFMETQAHHLAVEGKCLHEPRYSKKISMVELFDMVAGVETGAILATTISQKNQDIYTNATMPNKYFARAAL